MPEPVEQLTEAESLIASALAEAAVEELRQRRSVSVPDPTRGGVSRNDRQRVGDCTAEVMA